MITKFRDFIPGVQVKLTGNYLISTGQRKGGEGSKRWIVLECSCGLCRLGRHAAVNEPSTTQFAQEEIEKEPGIVNRHIAKENLSVVGQVDHRNCGDTYVGVTFEGLLKGHKEESSKELKQSKSIEQKVGKTKINLEAFK